MADILDEEGTQPEWELAQAQNTLFDRWEPRKGIFECLMRLKRHSSGLNFFAACPLDTFRRALLNRLSLIFQQAIPLVPSHGFGSNDARGFQFIKVAADGLFKAGLRGNCANPCAMFLRLIIAPGFEIIVPA